MQHSESDQAKHKVIRTRYSSDMSDTELAPIAQPGDIASPLDLVATLGAVMSERLVADENRRMK